MTRPPIFVPVFLLIVSSALYAEDRQPALLDLELTQRSLFDVDINNSPNDNEILYQRNRRYLRDALKTYSQQALSLIGVPNQTVNMMGATVGFVINGAKLHLNDSKTLAIELKDVTTHDPALYFGYKLAW